ncbi:MAG: PadR family transcriptional regulator [Leptolinea sp.]|nr:PadR family transcriptional regulator [Leptolinea sp.]
MPRHGRGWAMGANRSEIERHSPIILSILEPALLVLLQEKPKHGYLLLTEITDLGIKTIHPSVVYKILRDMEMLTWITSDWEPEATQGPPRRIYRITEHGKLVTQNWMKELEKAEDLIHILRTRIR